MAKTIRARRRPWTPKDVRELRALSRQKESVKRSAKKTGRTVGALRQKAHSLGLSLGHRNKRRA